MNTIFPGTNQWVQPGYSIIGTCSICGGAVTVPTIWAGTVPPTPTCTSCGAIKKETFGPVIDMVPTQRHRTTVDMPKFGYSYDANGSSVTFGSTPTYSTEKSKD